MIKRSAAVVIQPNPITPEERMGPQIVALMVVRDGAAECLHSLSLELPVAS
jgi:hypothetical protein